MGDEERLNLLLRYEALAYKLRLNSTDAYTEGLLKALDKMVLAYTKSDGRTQLQRRKDITAAILEEIDPLYQELAANLLEDMGIIATLTAGATAATFLENPVTKVLNFTANTLIHNYELQDLIRSNNEDTIRQFKREIAIGISEGLSSKQVYKNLKDLAEKKTQHISQTIIQSAMAAARESAKDDVFMELERRQVIKGYEYVATLDARTCAICVALDGRKWEKLSDIPPSQKPKIHFRCRCTLAPITTGDAKRAGQQYFENAPKEGTQFPNIDYYDWLALQPKAVQDAIKSKNRIDLTKLQSLANL
jgi:SPP1 gp7 family putative phage head morphogenesis protein